MITLDIHKPNLFEVTISGHISRDDVRVFYAGFKPALDEAGRTGVVIDMTAFHDIAPDALIEDLIEELGLLNDLSKMPRVAIITGLRFIAGSVKYFNPVIPRMDVRAFDPAERQEAETWAADLPPDRKRPGLSLLDSGDADVLAFELDGYIDDDHLDDLVRPFQAKIDACQASGTTFNALVRLKNFTGFDPEILFDKGLLGMKWGAVRHMGRYAIVTDTNWVKPFAAIAQAVTPADVRLFPMAEEDKAWDWVRETSKT